MNYIKAKLIIIKEDYYEGKDFPGISALIQEACFDNIIFGNEAILETNWTETNSIAEGINPLIEKMQGWSDKKERLLISDKVRTIIVVEVRVLNKEDRPEMIFERSMIQQLTKLHVGILIQYCFGNGFEFGGSQRNKQRVQASLTLSAVAAMSIRRIGRISLI